MRGEPVLVAFATRHHGTEGIAREIAIALGEAGFAVDLVPAEAVTSIEGYSAVVLGSAVYMVHWEGAALDLLRRERRALACRPVWLFSSGPVGEGKTTRRPETVPQPDVVAELAAEIGARGQAMFGGRVDPTEGGFDTAVMSQAGLEGDWRDLHKVRMWARTIAATLRASPEPASSEQSPAPGWPVESGAERRE